MSDRDPRAVLLVLHGWPPEDLGGTGLYVSALARALRRRGIRTLTLAPRPNAARRRPRLVPADDGDGDAWLVELPPPRTWSETWRRPDTDALVAGLVRAQAADIVHVHHLAHASLGWLRAARHAGAGLVLTLHDYQLPCARGQLVDRDLQPCPGPSPERCAGCLGEHLRLSPLTRALAAATRRTPRLARQGRRRLAVPDPRGRLQTADRLAAVRAALRQPHRLLSPSRDLADRFAALGLRRPEHLSLPLVQAIAPAPPPGRGPLRLLFASSVIPTKGPHRLVAAFRKLPRSSATLTIAGPTPSFDGRPDYARRLRVEVERTPGARWVGPVPPARMSALLAAHDVLVLPSTWPENSPLVVREAAAAGLRLIVPAQGGAGELVPEARQVPPDDDRALVDALRAEVATGRGRSSPRTWEDPDAHAARLVDRVYRPVLENPTG